MEMLEAFAISLAICGSVIIVVSIALGIFSEKNKI
jgi:hypothetical protein